MSDKASLAAWFKNDDGDREKVLKRKRLCAALTRPTVLPVDNQQENDEFPDTYQSEGSAGVRHLSGRIVSSMFPAGEPWFQFLPATEYWHDPEIPDELKQELADKLFMAELVAQSKLERVVISKPRLHHRSTFQAHKSRTIAQLVITGDTLEHINDDYRMRLFRNDQYVTKRNSACDVLYHLIREKIDALSLSEEQRARCNLNDDKFTGSDPSERMVELYTLVRYQPDSRTWVITQEVNERTLVESEETVSPYLSSSTYLVPGEHYGRSIVEDELGDLRSLNELELSRLNMAALAAKAHPALDRNCEAKTADFSKQPGEPIHGFRVEGGVVQDAGWFGYDKIRELTIVTEAVNSKRESLSKAFLSLADMGSVQGRDRVTRFEREQVQSQFNASIIDELATVAEDQQVPLLARIYYMMKRDNIMPQIPEDAMEIHTITGVSQMVREQRASKILNSVQIAQALGDEAMARVDMGTVLNLYNRYVGVYEPGMVKTDEQVAEEQRQRQQSEQATIAAQAAADTSVNVATEAAKAEFGS